MKSQDNDVELGKRASGTATVMAKLKSFRTAGQPQRSPVPKQCGISAVSRDCMGRGPGFELFPFPLHLKECC